MTTAALSEGRRKMHVLYDHAKANPSGYRDIDPTNVARVVGKVRIVDVREPHELTGELGHIAGIESVPLSSVEHAAGAWDKEQELVVVCRSGGRSGRAAAYLASIGFARVMNMVGGMLAWNDAKLPVER
jgi:sulfur-carrier protein adenylyltransferase/sulfurtransferase